MKCVTVKDFGIALEVNGVTVRQRIVRKKLVKNPYGFIDIENVTNYSYIVETNGGDLSVFDKYLVAHLNKANVNKKVTLASVSEKKVTKVSEKVVKVPNAKEVVVFAKPNKLTLGEKREMQERKAVQDTLTSFDLRKREADVKLVERNAELKQWELEKKAGNTLPMDMIDSVIQINFKAIYKTNFSLANNVAMVIVQELGGSKEDLHRIRKNLESAFDKTVRDTEKKSSIDIEKLVDEYSEVRSRGERKV